MATHSSILAWRIPMGRGACQATVHSIAHELDTTERLSTAQSAEHILQFRVLTPASILASCMILGKFLLFSVT